jgi:hypothetical protein
MNTTYKDLTNFLVGLGVEEVAHSQKSFLAHLIAVYRYMKDRGCGEELSRAGMFHSIYGTQQFQAFALPLERRQDVRDLIGDRAERIAYLNCLMERDSFDRAALQDEGPYRVRVRETGEEVEVAPDEFDDLCRVHLYDWLEQVPRSRFGWDYRRAAYRRLAERLGGPALAAYDQVFAEEPAAAK